MTKEKLTELKTLLTEFYNNPVFDMSEMHELTQIKEVIELVDGVIYGIDNNLY